MNLNPSTPNKLIVALDVADSTQAIAATREISDIAGAYKIGLQLFTSEGPAFVREIVSDGHRIFLDLKFHDIPNTVAKASVEAARLGVWMFNVHALGGGEMMRRAFSEMSEFCYSQGLARPLMIAVTILTSSDSSTLRDSGIDPDLDSQVLRLAELTAKCGLDGVVASPHEIGRIRSEIGNDFVIVTPGVRPATAVDRATSDDQKRVMTPADAVAAGADYLVVGRPILGQPDRRSAARSIADEIARSE